jgi:hypothetical protein
MELRLPGLASAPMCVARRCIAIGIVVVTACSFPPPPDVGPDAGDDDDGGDTAEIAIDGTPHDFGAVDVGSRSEAWSVTATNEGTHPTGPIAVEVVGANAEDFEVAADGCGGNPLAAGASCTVDLEFAPKGGGARAGRLTVAATPGGLVAVDLSGTGVSDCVASTTTCEDDRYVECDADGHVSFEMQCPLGCAATSGKCEDIAPSNGLAAYLDMSADGPDVTMGSWSINTTTGVVSNEGGGAVEIPNALYVQEDSSVAIRVYWVRSLSIAGTVVVTGNPAVAFVSDGDVSITGTLDVSAKGITKGPGQTTGACAPGIVMDNLSRGAGGAGNNNNGAKGGNTSGGTTGGAGGTFVTDDTLVPLFGGCVGGGVGSPSVGGVSAGGGGGGAVQIVSRTVIRLTGSGIINASGGGGTGGAALSTAAGGGGGGGSGGGILLEAPEVLLDGSGVVLSTKGGGGGSGADFNAKGADGGTGGGVAAGGMSGTYANGGSGGTLGVSPTAGANGNGSHQAGGGGGGSAGRTRINTPTGTCSPQGGALIRSPSTVGTIEVRQVPASSQ